MDNTDHFYLERYEIKRLHVAVKQLIDIWPTLEATLVRQNRFGEQPHVRHSGRIDTPLPFHVGASQHCHHVAVAVNAIAEAVATQRQLTPPTYSNPRHTLHWVSDHIIDLALCPDAEDYAQQLHQLTQRTFYIVDRPKPLTFLGVCPSCGNRVYSEDTVGLIPCPHCGELLDAIKLGDELNKRLEAAWCTHDQAMDFLKARGIKKSTCYAWLDEIIPAEVNGRPYWRVSDLFDRVKNKGKHNRKSSKKVYTHGKAE